MEVLHQWARAISAAGGTDGDVALLLGATEVALQLHYRPKHTKFMETASHRSKLCLFRVHTYTRPWAVRQRVCWVPAAVLRAQPDCTARAVIRRRGMRRWASSCPPPLAPRGRR